MIKITHIVSIVDGEKKDERIAVYKENGDISQLLSLFEAQELYTALGEKLKEIEIK